MKWSVNVTYKHYTMIKQDGIKIDGSDNDRIL